MAAVRELSNKIIRVKLTLECDLDALVLTSVFSYLSGRSITLMSLTTTSDSDSVSIRAFIQIRTYQNKLLLDDLSKLRQVKCINSELQDG